MANYTKNWCFTLNNYVDYNVQEILGLQCYSYLIVGREVGADGTPHLQGYIQFRERKRFTAVQKIIARAHWEAARGTQEQNREYCSKDGDFEERGQPIVQGKHKKANLAEAVIDWADNRPTTREMLLKYGGGFVQNKRKIKDCAEDIRQESIRDVKKRKYNDTVLRPWQAELRTALQDARDQDVDHRWVFWVYSTDGNVGKSYMANYLKYEFGAFVTDNGKTADIKYAYNGQHVVCFDFVRSSQDHINYEIIETIKNGRYTNTKYESRDFEFWPPRIVCFANQWPDIDKLSDDRWRIYQVKDGDLEMQYPRPVAEPRPVVQAPIFNLGHPFQAPLARRRLEPARPAAAAPPDPDLDDASQVTTMTPLDDVINELQLSMDSDDYDMDVIAGQSFPENAQVEHFDDSLSELINLVSSDSDDDVFHSPPANQLGIPELYNEYMNPNMHWSSDSDFE